MKWRRKRTYGFGLEALDEDAVEEGDDGLDGLERCLGSLRGSGASVRAERRRRGRRGEGSERTMGFSDETEDERASRATAYFLALCLAKPNSPLELSRIARKAFLFLSPQSVLRALPSRRAPSPSTPS